MIPHNISFSKNLTFSSVGTPKPLSWGSHSNSIKLPSMKGGVDIWCGLKQYIQCCQKWIRDIDMVVVMESFIKECSNCTLWPALYIFRCVYVLANSMMIIMILDCELEDFAECAWAFITAVELNVKFKRIFTPPHQALIQMLNGFLRSCPLSEFNRNSTCSRSL